jgi:hypothetical protein
MRICHERNTAIDEKTMISFVTATYDNEHLPANGSLCKRDWILYQKRLRKELAKQGRKIRIYAVGEYGQRGTLRPHYHAIIFGLDWSKYHLNRWEQKIFDDKELAFKCWGKCNRINFKVKPGHDEEAIQYTAKYVQKKNYGVHGKKYYADLGIEEPFMVCSKGIGRKYFEDKLMEEAKKTCEIKFNKWKKGVGRKEVIVGLPKYYRQLAGITREQLEERNERVRKENHQKLAQAGIIATMEQVVMNVPGYMIPSYKAYYDKYKTLPSIKEAEKMNQRQTGLMQAKREEIKASRTRSFRF